MKREEYERGRKWRERGRAAQRERRPEGHLSISAGVKWAGACALLPRKATLSLTLDADVAARRSRSLSFSFFRAVLSRNVFFSFPLLHTLFSSFSRFCAAVTAMPRCCCGSSRSFIPRERSREKNLYVTRTESCARMLQCYVCYRRGGEFWLLAKASLSLSLSVLSNIPRRLIIEHIPI